MATWRSGYAADCKSHDIYKDNNALDVNRYQDIAYTSGEPDNRDDPPPETKKADHDCTRDRPSMSYETTQFQAKEYDGNLRSARRQYPADAEICEFELADGHTLCMECSPAGLIETYDFTLRSGAVLRFEKRIFQTIPGLSPIDERTPQWWETDEDAIRSSKAMMVAYWNGMPERDRVTFLQKVVDPATLRRAAA